MTTVKGGTAGYCAPILLAIASTASPQDSGPNETQPYKARSSRVIEEVLVTTSKREESLMDVLGSVTAVSSEKMERENIQDYQRLAELVPGMVALDEENIAIRGISRSRQGPSPVAFHVNGVFLGEQGEPFYDLEAVEVVRGPSGTVYGRNATAGAINAKWKRPEPEWGGGLNLRYSTLTEEQIKGYLNVPLFEIQGLQTGARFAFMKRRGDGTLDNLLTPDDEDPGNFDDQFVRMYLTTEVSEDISIAFQAIAFESNPKGAPAVRSPSLFTRASGDLERGGAEPLPMDLEKVRSTVHERFGKTEDTSNRATLEFNFSHHEVPLLGNFDTVLIGAYQDGHGEATFDADGTEAPIFDAKNTVEVDRVRSGELRFTSNNDTGIDWIVGLFWYKETELTGLDALITAAPSTGQALELIGPDFVPRVPPFPGDPGLLITTPVQQLVFTEQEGKAFYLNYNFDLVRLFDAGPNIEVTAGVRRNFDETFGETLENSAGDPQPPDFAKFQVTTGELGLRWFYSDEGMLYTKLSRGYKPGFSQIVTDEAGNERQNPVDPEFLNAFELGWKTAFLDRSLQMELAGYYYDYGDLQVTQLGGPSGIVTSNAAAATIFGIELGLHWRPTANFNLNFSASAMRSAYDDYCGLDPSAPPQENPDPGCTENNPTDFSGETTQAAPPLAATLSASYDFSLNEFGTVTPSIRTSWSDELERRGLGNPHDVVDSYTTTDIRLTWTSPERSWSVEAFAENLEDNTDTFFTAFGPVLVVGGSPNTFTLGDGLPPRKYGVTIDYKY